ncbi:MAG: nuclear transport factor 2 family protein [Gammaproteobacteria bacterium]|nr:nuclear transport factor 2 family protein [Gammaproteobacteria bacterium]
MQIRALLVAATALLFVFPAIATEITGGTEEDRAQMVQVSKNWLDAYASGDLDGIMAVMHADAMLMPHNQSTSHGTEEVRAYFATRIGRPGVKLVDDLQEIRINGDWAYVRGKFRFEIDLGPEKPPIIHNGRYLILYEKTGGNWKVLRDMDNLDPVTEQPASVD